MHNPGRIRLAVIAGATATGKSDVALMAAKALDGEIINADSVQLYRYFDIGSAKPTPDMRREVPHHLVDILEPDRHFTLWDFKVAAQEAIREVAARGKLPILCGGTGLYIKAVLENLHGGAKRDEGLRRELLATPREDLYARLKTLDAARAETVHPNDTYRIIRGIENALLPGRDAAPEKPPYDPLYFILSVPRVTVYERIGARVDRMLAAGWVKEARGIVARGFSPECKPFKSVGYSQVMRYLSGGMTMDELSAQVKQATRRYAKRQSTWFSAVEGAIAVDAADTQKAVDAVLRHLAA